MKFYSCFAVASPQALFYPQRRAINRIERTVQKASEEGRKEEKKEAVPVRELLVYPSRRDIFALLNPASLLREIVKLPPACLPRSCLTRVFFLFSACRMTTHGRWLSVGLFSLFTEHNPLVFYCFLKNGWLLFFEVALLNISEVWWKSIKTKVKDGFCKTSLKNRASALKF